MEAKKLAGAEGTKFCGILFMSFTCPIGRTFGCHDLYKAVTDKGIPVLCVYTIEAHPHGDGGFPHPMNESGPVAVDIQLPLARTPDERRRGALALKETLEKELGGEEL